MANINGDMAVVQQPEGTLLTTTEEELATELAMATPAEADEA